MNATSQDYRYLSISFEIYTPQDFEMYATSQDFEMYATSQDFEMFATSQFCL